MANSNCATKSAAALFAATLLLSGSGCVSMSTLQDWNYQRAQRTRASVAWYEDYDRDCRRSLSRDFECGYKAGFIDASDGKTCTTPPVPPPKYWNASYQSCEGQTYIQDWFRGYAAGQAAAESRGFPDFHELPTSATAPVLNRTGCGTCYAPDQCAEPNCISTSLHHAHPSVGEVQAIDIQILQPGTVNE